MTIIAAYKGPDGIYMAGDTMAAGPDDAVYLDQPKVFSLNGLTIGFCESFRFGGVLAHCFEPPTHNPILDDNAYMFGVFMESVRDTLDAYGMLKSENGVESIGEGGSALVIYRDNIYYLQLDLSILKSASPYAAIGCGSSYAIGAMYALHGTMGGLEVITKAMDAALHHAPRCGGNVTYLKHDGSTEVEFVKPRIRKTKNDLVISQKTKLPRTK